MQEQKSRYTIVMSDFNANVGERTNPSELVIGTFGLDERNEREIRRMGNNADEEMYKTVSHTKTHTIY